MRFFILIILTIISFSSLAQISGKISDSKTGEPIPYANVTIEGKNIGGTSNLEGEFTINYSNNNSTIIISAIGYESQKVVISGNSVYIKLESKSYDIESVTIKPRRAKISKTLNSLKDKKTSNYAACNQSPWIIAKHFEYSKEYSNTPFVKSVGILVKSNIMQSKFNLRLIEANDDGTPGNDILSENIIIKAKLGKRVINIDLTDKYIIFPKNGIFVAVEWLMIDDNKMNITYTQVGEKKKHKGIRYEPMFGLLTENGIAGTWISFGGKWHNTSLNHGAKDGKSSYLALELTLTD
jgi:hypothetical protein